MKQIIRCLSEFLDSRIIQYGLDDELEGPVDWEPLFYRILHKYLSTFPDDIQKDIMIELYVKLNEREAKIFGNYSRDYGCSLEGYLGVIVHRAASEVMTKEVRYEQTIKLFDKDLMEVFHEKSQDINLGDEETDLTSVFQKNCTDDTESYEFDELISLMKDRIQKSTKKSEKQLKIFDLLLHGFNIREIASYFGCTDMAISNRVRQIREDLNDLATQLEDEGNINLRSLIDRHDLMNVRCMLSKVSIKPNEIGDRISECLA